MAMKQRSAAGAIKTRRAYEVARKEQKKLIKALDAVDDKKNEKKVMLKSVNKEESEEEEWDSERFKKRMDE